jgi:hypothetical protein
MNPADRVRYEVEPEQRHNPTPVLTPTESRQGVISGHVRTILIASLMLAFMAGAILMATGIRL